VVVCKIKLFQNRICFRRRLSEIILFQRVETFVKLFQYKITFKRTRSLSNAMYFKHDSNVCACAVTALILLSIVNLSVEIILLGEKWIQRHRFRIWRGNCSRPTLLVVFGDFSTILQLLV